MLVSKSIVLSLSGRLAVEDSTPISWRSIHEQLALSDLFIYESMKRLVDVIISGSLLILLTPLLLLIAAAVKISSPGPVVFSQSRLTKGGRIFTIYKFRTMQADAERETGAVWAQARDPRITRLGKFLRCSRLDELLQLINVLRGEMSLIGPRPERPEFAAELAQDIPAFYRRLEVKAGISGLAQVVSGYSASKRSYKRKVALDLIYIRRRSLILDLKIAIRTVGVMLTGFGAH